MSDFFIMFGFVRDLTLVVSPFIAAIAAAVEIGRLIGGDQNEKF